MSKFWVGAGWKSKSKYFIEEFDFPANHYYFYCLLNRARSTCPCSVDGKKDIACKILLSASLENISPWKLLVWLKMIAWKAELTEMGRHHSKPKLWWSKQQCNGGDLSEGLVEVVTLLQFPFILVYFFFTGCVALLSPLFQNTCGQIGVG